jgi:calcineurin-like phosphoesterase family protein
MNLNEFPWNLENGDEVIIKNIKRVITVQDVVYYGVRGHDNCIIVITSKLGEIIECHPKDLS